MNCSYCFRNKASDNYKIKNLNNYKKIIDKLIELKIFDSINFAGGEPTLFKELPILLGYSKNKGFSNSLITNGWVIATQTNFLKEILSNIDVLGLSIDSLNNQVNLNSGRNFLKQSLTLKNLTDIYDCVVQSANKNIKFKINTVVSSFNKDDNSLLQIPNNICVDRWKFLNVHNFKKEKQSFEVTDEDFNKFVNQFAKIDNIRKIVVEPKGSMLNSYIMVDGLGNICCNTTNKKIINILSSTNEEICKFIENNLDVNEYCKRYK